MSEPHDDLSAHRNWLISLTTLREGGRAVDLGCGRGDDLSLLAQRRGLMKPSDHEWFLVEQERLAREDRYFYSITGFAYVGYRRAL